MELVPDVDSRNGNFRGLKSCSTGSCVVQIKVYSFQVPGSLLGGGDRLLFYLLKKKIQVKYWEN